MLKRPPAAAQAETDPASSARPADEDAVLQLRDVSKLFGTVRAVDRAALDIRRGEVFTLLGPSGCGKTTTLRLVAGLERPDEGEIILRGRPVASVPRGIFVPPHKRNLGMVFQSYAIWPHMTVYDNIAYPLKLRRMKSTLIKDKVSAILDVVGLAGLEKRPATLLSGGQMQRLALCRALVYEPDLLLLDEPFSNLDAKLREQMRVDLKVLQRRLGITVLFVTHDQIEALSLSDRIAVMNRGNVEQLGPPRDLYERPASAFVRDFLGQTVILRGRVTATDADGFVTVTLDGAAAGRTLTGRPSAAGVIEEGTAVHLAVRPEDVEVTPDDRPVPERDVLTGTLEAVLFVGDRYEARVALGAEESIQLHLPKSRNWREGQGLQLRFSPESVSVWPV